MTMQTELRTAIPDSPYTVVSTLRQGPRRWTWGLEVLLGGEPVSLKRPGAFMSTTKPAARRRHSAVCKMIAAGVPLDELSGRDK